MKLITKFCTAVLISTTLSFAQEKSFNASKGDIWFGGGLSYSSLGFKFEGESGNLRINTFNIAPILRFFPTDGLILGPKVDYSRISYSHSDEINGYNYLGMGGELGYLAGNLKVKPFVLAAPQFHTLFDSKDGEVGFTMPITAGVMIPVTDHIGLQLETGIQFRTYSDYDYSTNQFFVGFGICGFGKRSAVSMTTKILDPVHEELLW